MRPSDRGLGIVLLVLGGLVLLRVLGLDLFTDLVVRGLALAVAVAGVIVLTGRSRGRTSVGLMLFAFAVLLFFSPRYDALVVNIVLLLMAILLALAGVMKIQGKW